MTAFTICSNNYLAKAQVLLASLKAKSKVPVYLILADKKSEEIDYEALGFDEVILPEQLGIANLKWQLENYHLIEFNTALKGAAFKYLFNKISIDQIYYFDPDIKVYQDLALFADYWQDYSILLTPHILAPVPHDGLFPGENLFLNHGTFNLGFLGLKRSEISFQFLDWWSERLANKCVIDLKEGYFTDQIWLNLVPVLFKDVKVLLHPGFNAAYWNLHDRTIELQEDEYVVNNSEKLFFYHFSSFDPSLKRLMPRVDGRLNFEEGNSLFSLYVDYKSDLSKYPADYTRIKYYDGLYPLAKPAVPFLKRIVNRAVREFKR